MIPDRIITVKAATHPTRAAAAALREVYAAPVSTRKLHHPPRIIDAAVSSHRSGNYLKRVTDLDKHQHAALSVHWGLRRIAAAAAWRVAVEREFLKIHGRPYQTIDYRISGIARDEFSERVKTRLRGINTFIRYALALQCAHGCAAGKLATLRANADTVKRLALPGLLSGWTP